MPSTRFTCPMCRTVLALDSHVGANESTRCPDCHTIFRLPEMPAAPRVRRSLPPTSASGGGSGALWVILILSVVGIALFVLVGAGVGIYFAVRGKGGPGLSIGGASILGNSAANMENFDKLAIAMTRPEVEAILGKGKRADQSDMDDAFAEDGRDFGPRGPASGAWLRNAQGAGVTQWYRWQNGDFSIFVGFAKGRSGKERAMLSFWVQRLIVPGGGHGFESGTGLLGATILSDPDDVARDREKENQQLRDPKWNKGNVRQMIVGSWGDGISGYVFGANGSVQATGFTEYTTTYRFAGNDEIEWTAPPLGNFPGAMSRQVRYRVLVTVSELWLVEPERKGLVFKYKRGAAGLR